MKAKERFTVSGPQVDRSYSERGISVSAAINFAERSPEPVTIYVREEGEVVARVERDEHRHVYIYSNGGSR